ncbi:ankyrin repeat-containing domain protein [Tirmania nivea]|nr:ankyrin repeat-containing domain protein [Tirmania nivea]
MSEKNRDAFYNWLSPCEHESHHLDQGEGILENTGTWLFEMNTQFKNWQNSKSSSVLWVRGDPGVGKSRLTYAGIEVVQKRASAEEIVIYFYCSRGEDVRRRPEMILGTLIKQILKQIPFNSSTNTPPALSERYQARNERGALRINELQEWLSFLLARGMKATILIDAVDEIFPDRRYQFLEVLRNLISNNDLMVKIWISGREETDIRLTFTQMEEVVIYRQHEGEIRTYVEREITKLIHKKALLLGEVDDNFKRQIVDRISEKSEGMFLWAHLQIEGLKMLNRRKHLEDRLNTLPKDLTATYDEMYQMILAEDHADDCEAAQMALRWVMCAVRPLSPEEWAHAAWLSSTFIYIEASVSGIDDVPDIKPSVLQKLCHTFVSIDKQLNVVRFAHLSVREYLERKANFMELVPDYMASKTCLGYLSRSRSIVGPFSKYIIDYWSDHCKRISERSNTGGQRPPQHIVKSILELVRNFLHSGYVYQRWLSHVNEVEFCKDIDPLFVAARYGLSESCKEMLACSGQNPAPRNMERRTPLHAAAQFGHKDVVRLYIDVQNVDLNDMDKDGRTPLAWAVFCEHQSVVKILLMSTRVKVNIPDGLGKFAPLTRASWRGSEQMVKILAEANGVEIDKRDGFGMTALMWASRRGDTPVMAALMERGANVNARDNYNRTALHWALISKELEAFALLTKDSKVNVNCMDVNGMTPLFYACKYRSGKILDRTLKRLLEVKGIDVNAPCYWTTALIVAADAGRHDAIRRLTRAPGIEVNAVTLKGRTALIIATLNKEFECIRALVETARGLDLRHEDASGKTALVYAVEKGFEEITQLFLTEEGIKLTGSTGLESLQGNTDLNHEELIAKARDEAYCPIPRSAPKDSLGAEHVFEIARWASQGALEAQQKLTLIDTNVKNSCGETALHLAARYSNKTSGLDISVTLLAIPGIETDPTDLCDKTPLSEAARLGNASLVSVLLKTPGVNPNARDMRGRTPLFLSARGKPENRDVVGILLRDPRIDINAADKNGVTPISQAVHNKAAEVAELLLRTGNADVNLADHMGFTPLTYAAMKGLFKILEMLLKAPGIDIECQDDRWYTPLALAAKYGHKDEVDELVKAGASLMAKTNRGLTPLELAEEYGHVGIVELLNNAG